MIRAVLTNSIGSRAIPEWIVHGAAFVVVGLMLVAAGQPLFSDDAWFHLALGRAYAESGPWLAEDPLLYTAPGPPTPSAWLFELGLYGMSRSAGLYILRVFHLSCVGAILALAWSLLRRASGSTWIASLGTLTFTLFAAYRLVQLRPHLLSMLFALVLYRLCLEGRGAICKPRMAMGIGLLVIWANTHAAFLLGPLMLIAGASGLLCALMLRPLEAQSDNRRRGVELLFLGLVGLLATSLNPGFLEPHLAWFVSGGTTPDLGIVSDEWLPVNPFELPRFRLPPSPLSWGLYGVMLIACPIAVIATIRAWLAGAERARASASPALVAVALGTLVAPMLAVRFLWLMFFTLLLLAATLRRFGSIDCGRPAHLRWAGAGMAVALVVAFPRVGAWPMISRGVSFADSSYAEPYPASKYFSHAVWFMKDAGLRGNLFNEYSQGGFLGYWLGPEVRTFVNGSLNLTPDAMDAYTRIRARRGRSPEEGFGDLLASQDIDLFLGTGLPVVPLPARPQTSTVGHIEGMSDWVLVFRNLSSAVYVRKGPRNAVNLERIADYYAAHGVPFDLRHGFEPWRVIQEAHDWAIAHGVVPPTFASLVQRVFNSDRVLRRSALENLAAVYAGLGLYERAADLESRVLRMEPEAFSSRRRLVWSCLRAGRLEQAHDEAAPLIDSPDLLSRAIAEAATEVAELGSEEAAARISLLPVFTRDEGAALRRMVAGPRSRRGREMAATPWRYTSPE
jgi:hypothetical protein